MKWFKFMLLLYAGTIIFGLSMYGAICMPNYYGALIFGIPSFGALLMLAIDGAIK